VRRAEPDGIGIINSPVMINIEKLGDGFEIFCNQDASVPFCIQNGLGARTQFLVDCAGYLRGAKFCPPLKGRTNDAVARKREQ